MSHRDYLRRRRNVKIGGWRIGRRSFGGRWYIVEPMTTMRFAQYLEVSKQLGDVLRDRGGLDAMLERTPARMLRPLVPILVSAPIRERDLKRCSDAQVYAVYRAWNEVNGLMDMLGSLDLSGGTGKGRGIERLVLAFAREMHYRIDEVWAMPYRELVAAVKGLAAEDADIPDGAEPLSDEERRDLKGTCMHLGFEVN